MFAQRLAARFTGPKNRASLIQALERQDLVDRNETIAIALADAGEVRPINNGAALIQEGDVEDDVYYILAGSFEVRVRGRKVGDRGHGTQVGDYSVLDQHRKRTATLIATEDSVVLRVAMSKHRELLQGNAEMALEFARQILVRKDERNALIRPANEEAVVFIVSSSEQASVVDTLAETLRALKIAVQTWDRGTFLASTYPLEALEDKIRGCDFTVSIVAGDDVVVSRGQERPAPRDNVHVEFGMSVGMFGRQRSIILYDVAAQAKLASDQAGITYLTFDSSSEDSRSRTLSVSAKEIADRVRSLGPHRSV